MPMTDSDRGERGGTWGSSEAAAEWVRGAAARVQAFGPATERYLPRPMPHVLAALIAFAAEHQRCGDLDGGTDNGYVWMQCSCGGLITHPAEEPPRHLASTWPAWRSGQTLM